MFEARLITAEEARQPEAFRKKGQRIVVTGATIIRQKVSCPQVHCVGYAYLDIKEYRDGSKTAEGIEEPRKCVVCKNYMKIEPHMTFRGIPHDG